RCRFRVGELEGGRQLDGELPLLQRGQSLELGADLLDRAAAPLLDEQPHEIADERFALAEDGVDRGGLRALVELRIAQDLTELGHLLRRLDEAGELLAGLGDAPGLLRGLVQGPRVGAVDDAQTLSFSSTEKSSSPIASSISLRWSSRSSTLPVTFEVA